MTVVRASSETRRALANKVRAMLVLADPSRGGAEGERDAAMAKATAFIAKHNIQEWELVPEQDRPHVTHREYFTKGKTKKWEGMLYHYIGSAVGCRAVYAQVPLDKWAWKWTLIGKDTDLDFMEALYDALLPWLKLQAKLARNTTRPSNPNAFNRAFFDNAGHIIHTRLKAQRDEAYNSSSSGSALVLATNSENERYQQELFGRTVRKSKGRGYSNVSGEISGRIAGSKADISTSRKVGTSNRQLPRGS